MSIQCSNKKPHINRLRLFCTKKSLCRDTHNLRPSKYYRSILVPWLGCRVNIESSDWTAEPTTYGTDNCSRILLRNCWLIRAGGGPEIQEPIPIDHIYIYVDDGWMNRNGYPQPGENLSVIGKLYEYRNSHGTKNIGIDVLSMRPKT